jgi:V8-like Glu-specific endopeptidase
MKRWIHGLLFVFGAGLAGALVPLETVARQALVPQAVDVTIHAVDTAGAYPQWRLPPEMLNAEAMPMPEAVQSRPAQESDLPLNRRIVDHDPATGVTFVGAAGAGLEGLVPDAPQFLGDTSLYAWDPLFSESDVGTTASQPSPVTNTTSYPWRTIGKLRMRFGANSWYVCTAETTGTFHVLTAAHCIYNHDFPGDEWAREVWWYPAQTDVAAPTGAPEFPYGEGRAIWYRTYTGWTESHDYAHDWAVLTLDRRAGDRVGWMGRSSSVGIGDSVNIAGYPAEAAYGFGGNLFLYHSFDEGNVLCADLPVICNGRVALSAYTYGGQSGGPVWRYESDTGNRYIVGMNSTSNRSGYAEATYLSSGKREDLNAWMEYDAVNRPPADRPDITEYGENFSDVLTGSVQEGTVLKAQYSIVNMGFAASGAMTVNFYLSTDTKITTGDALIGTHSLGSLPDWTYTNPTASLRLPLSVAPGTYRFGWIMSAAQTEYSTANNTGVITTETVSVTACPEDSLEQNDSFSAARSIAPGSIAGLRVCVDDEDWYKTSVPEGYDLKVDALFTHASGNLDLRVYDQNAALRGSSTSTTDNESVSLAPVPFAGSYSFRVTGADHATNAYALQLALAPHPTSTVGTAGGAR